VTAATHPDVSNITVSNEDSLTVTDNDVEAALAAYWASTDADEAMQARLERRAPEFHGR
jgi:hypothetical protein